ncbi:hypothetical protein MRX96_018295 [Rhipicephalus microplus]
MAQLGARPNLYCDTNAVTSAAQRSRFPKNNSRFLNGCAHFCRPRQHRVVTDVTAPCTLNAHRSDPSCGVNTAPTQSSELRTSWRYARQLENYPFRKAWRRSFSGALVAGFLRARDRRTRRRACGALASQGEASACAAGFQGNEATRRLAVGRSDHTSSRRGTVLCCDAVGPLAAETACPPCAPGKWSFSAGQLQRFVPAKPNRPAFVIMSIEEARFSVLGYDQVVRLQELLEEPVSVQGRGNFPALETRLRDLVQRVRSQLDRQGVPVRDVRLNGGAASYVLEPDTSAEYNDLDVIFGCELGSSGAGGFERVKTAVLDALAELLPAGVKRINACALKEAYLHKLVKVATDEDRWSLVSLSNSLGRNVELKFVHRMRRQFEFSVDSFQIVVDPLLLLHQCGGGSAEALLPRCTQDFFPSVLAESVYGNFGQALEHLRRRLIATRNPEEIRGGGLLKYCHLLARGFHATDSTRALERYMCSRFFIDFPEIQAQRAKLHSFLANHLSHERLRYSFLATLYRVVDGSTQQPRLCGFAQPCWLLGLGPTLGPAGLSPGLAAGPL